MDDSQTAWTSLIGYLLGALYFFVMIGVPRSRGYTAKAMAWNRPQIAVSASSGSLFGCLALSPAWSALACCSSQSFRAAFDFELALGLGAYAFRIRRLARRLGMRRSRRGTGVHARRTCLLLYLTR